jgi:antitoxin VapB
MGYHTSLNLKSDEAYRLAKELAERTGTSMTAAVIDALRERLKHARKKETEAEFVERIMAIVKGARQEWSEPYLSADHDDLLYDEHGLPRDC